MIILEKPSPGKFGDGAIQCSCLMDIIRSSNLLSILYRRKNVITAGNPTSLTSVTHSMPR